MDSNAGLRMVFYGDDFTGASDALEVMAFAGYRSALFLKPPTARMLAKFPGLQVVGMAGDSRAMTPDEMDRSLPDLFDNLISLGAPIFHYKVCSTFDSAPEIGSIGRVMQIARDRFASSVIPVIAGTPALRRYCVFGNLFAHYNGDQKTYRIDHHPVMSVHPVTPMIEADLTLHLARQAPLSIGKFTVPMLDLDRGARLAELRAKLQTPMDALLFDATTRDHLTNVGQLLAEWPQEATPLFVVGSSGVEYALAQWWAHSGNAPGANTSLKSIAPVDRVLAVSGSASKLTELQIAHAVAAGFSDIAVNARDLIDEQTWPNAAFELVNRAVAELDTGRSVILHTARGPDDPRIGEMIDFLSAHGMSRDSAKHAGGRVLGVRLGHVVRDILERTPIKRLLLAGGDTSSQITQVLDFDALEVAARLTPGAPLCRALSSSGASIEIALKGGQIGDVDFFETARRGC
jgi:uncharacterized protein YgbK (DUF1537 family)